MLLSPVFSFVKSKLQSIADVKVITWYNAQGNESLVHNVPAVLVQFPETLRTGTLGGGKAQQAEITIRVQLVSKLHTQTNGEIDTGSMAAHEAIALKIYNELQKSGFKLPADGVVAINAMNRNAISLDMDNPGFAITTQDFACMIYQKEITNLTPVTPVAEILPV